MVIIFVMCGVLVALPIALAIANDLVTLMADAWREYVATIRRITGTRRRQ